MANKLYEALESRILLLDGGFGTMVQQYGFTEKDYRGERFRDWNVLLKGCNDLLAVTRPGAVREIHVKYLQAGADIIETDYPSEFIGLPWSRDAIHALQEAAMRSHRTNLK
jgi:5-methyltetrahydrofolate--homocysteine methyltransferase